MINVIRTAIIVICLFIINIDLFRLHFSISYLKKSLTFSLPMVLRLIISNIHKSFDKMILANFSGLNSVNFGLLFCSDFPIRKKLNLSKFKSEQNRRSKFTEFRLEKQQRSDVNSFPRN